jgi:outer membrane protein
VIVARTQAEIARVNVLADVGLVAVEGSVELAEPAALLSAPAPNPTAGTAYAEALSRRSEVTARQHEARAAEHQATARALAMLPDVDLEAAYQRVDGQRFAPKNSAFVGLRLQWAVFEWGSSLEQRRAAVSQATAARAAVDAEKLQIAREVATGRAQEEAARAAVGAARAAITSAEEAYRVTKAQLGAGTATTTDLLEAQAALTQTRLNLTRAEYAVAMARVALAHAMGE